MFNEYPYVNLQDVNLDWILKHIKDLETNLQDFVKLNTIKYADPIIWNITTQYETNTVVIDGNTGTAYLSVRPVPAGVSLTNDDYWTVIFTLNLTTSNQNITLRDDGTNVVATFDSNTGDWILWKFYLYRVTRPIAINTAYVEGFNIERFTVELFIKDYINTLRNDINTIIGDLDDLTTSDKDSVVDAINSVLSDLNTMIGDLNTMIGDLNDLTTSDKDSVVDAINSVVSDYDTKIGDLQDLDTSDKTSVVNAINEVLNTPSSDFPYKTPQDYGAVADGVTNDRQAFIDALSANDVIFVPVGTYLINGDIDIGYGKTIIGQDSIATVFNFTSGGFNVVERYCQLTNFSILTNTSPTTQAAINLAGTASANPYDIIISHVRIYNFYYGIKADTRFIWVCKFEDLRINDCEYGLIIGSDNSDGTSFENVFNRVYFDHCTKAVILKNTRAHFNNCAFSIIASDAIHIEKQSTTYFDFCHFECDSTVSSGYLIFLGTYHHLFTCCDFILRGTLQTYIFRFIATYGAKFDTCRFKFGGTSNYTCLFDPASSSTRYGTWSFINCIDIDVVYMDIINNISSLSSKPYLKNYDYGSYMIISGGNYDYRKMFIGMQFYDTTTNKTFYYNGTELVEM